MPQENTTTLYDERRLGFRKCLEAVKEGVPLTEYAAEHTELKRFGSGGWWRGRCPVPDHDDYDPSFSIMPADSNNLHSHVHCYGCGLHGDIFDLFQAVEGGELWEAMISLSQRYDIELPKRPDRWHRWQDEKHRRRNKMRDVFAKSYQRRLFAMYRSHLSAIEDHGERKEEARALWRDLWPLARMCAEGRISQKRPAA